MEIHTFTLNIKEKNINYIGHQKVLDLKLQIHQIVGKLFQNKFMNYKEYKKKYIPEAEEKKEKPEPQDTDPAHGANDPNKDGIEDLPMGAPTTFVVVFFDDSRGAISGMWPVNQGQSTEEIYKQAKKTLSPECFACSSAGIGRKL